jgi:Na+/H+ antiporter NhaA
MESEIRSTGGEICTVLVYYDHEIVLEGLKLPTVVCAIVLFVCEGQVGKSAAYNVIMVLLWSIY